MICTSCRRTLLARLRFSQVRALATVPVTPNAAPSSPPPPSISRDSHTPAISSANPTASQPFSTPIQSSIQTANAGLAGTKDAKKSKIQSSIPGGTELKGLAYLKATPKVLAKEDDEYPTWLWGLLEDGSQAGGKPTVDVAALTKKQRAKYDRKQAKIYKNIPKPIPVHEQSMDLTQPGDDAVTSLKRRQEVTKSSRDARRKDIRESNFLRGI